MGERHYNSTTERAREKLIAPGSQRRLAETVRLFTTKISGKKIWSKFENRNSLWDLTWEFETREGSFFIK